LLTISYFGGVVIQKNIVDILVPLALVSGLALILWYLGVSLSSKSNTLKRKILAVVSILLFGPLAAIIGVWRSISSASASLGEHDRPIED